MKTFLAVVRAFVTIVALVVVILMADSAYQCATDAKLAAQEARKSAADSRTLTITVTVTGTDANSRATAEKVIQKLKGLEHIAIPETPVRPKYTVSSYPVQ